MSRIVIISTCTHDWGGSEELWSKSIPLLQEQGYAVTVIKSVINRSHPEFIRLAQNGVRLEEVHPHRNFAGKIWQGGTKILKKLGNKLRLTAYPEYDFSALHRLLQAAVPELVIVSQGLNFDGLIYANQCLLLKIPYVTLAQNAVEFYWPLFYERKLMADVLLKARKNYFVSRHNLRLTEEQFGRRLPNSQVVFNPVKLSRDPVPYPPAFPVYRLACVARLFLIDKGQDILLRVLARPEWKSRPVVVTFVGKGDDEAGLKEMAALLGVENVAFSGQVQDIALLWATHHALILPSRSEGMPLAMLEAMSAGRTVIVTHAGGNAEIMEEGVTGFIGQANEASLAAAMERAWNQREEWETMGLHALNYIKAHVPECPEKEFTQNILEVIRNQ